MSSDYHISIQYQGVNHSVDLHETKTGAVEIGGRRYSIASDDGGLFRACLIRLGSLPDIKAAIDNLSLIGRVQRVVSGDEAISKRLDSHCEAFVRAGFTGSVLVEKDGKVLLDKEYGVAASEGERKPFYIASLSKQFTAAGIMQLVEREMIELDKPINMYLPLELRSEKWKDVTVHHLLSNTSGIYNFTDEPDYFETCEEKSPDSVLKEVQEKDLKFAPGTEFYYSNTNFCLLAKMIEHVSGRLYHDYIRDEIFIPAGMTSSRIQPAGVKTFGSGVVKGHHLSIKGELEEEVSRDLHLIYGAGGVISTGSDLAKWSHVLDGDTSILKKTSVDLMTTPHLKNEEGNGYGYGLSVYHENGRKYVGHEGTLEGFRTSFCKFPIETATIAVLANHREFQSNMVLIGLEGILLDGKSAFVEPVAFTGQDFSAYEGIFTSQRFPDAPKFRFSITPSGILQSIRQEEGKPPEIYPVFPLSNGRILIPSEGKEFEANKDGTISVYIFGQSKQMDILLP